MSLPSSTQINIDSRPNAWGYTCLCLDSANASNGSDVCEAADILNQLCGPALNTGPHKSMRRDSGAVLPPCVHYFKITKDPGALPDRRQHEQDIMVKHCKHIDYIKQGRRGGANCGKQIELENDKKNIEVEVTNDTRTEKERKMYCIENI